MRPFPLRLPRLPALCCCGTVAGVLGCAGRVGRASSSGDSAGLWSWKEDGSGSGRRLRIREAKDSLEARGLVVVVVKSRVVGGMALGSWWSLGDVDWGGGVGGRGRKKGIFRGDASGEVVVLCGLESSSSSSSGALVVVASVVLSL